MEATMSQPGPIKVWMMAFRLPTLVAALVPVAVGTALAYNQGELALGPALAALFGAFFIQIGTNIVNDLGDHERGADEDRLGPTRVVSAGLMSRRAATIGAVVTFLLALACGIYLTWVAGWPILVLGIVSIAAGIAYTTGPFPLAYHGLGDVFVFVFFGIAAVVGTWYVQAQSLSLEALALSVPVGCLATALLAINNYRDLAGDRAVGKRTISVRLGERGALAWYRFLVVAPFFAVVGYAVWTGSWGTVVPIACAPIAISLWQKAGRLEGKELNKVLVGTARLQLAFGVLLAMGLLWT